MQVRFRVVVTLLLTAAPAAFGAGLMLAPLFQSSDRSGMIQAMALSAALSALCCVAGMDLAARVRRRMQRRKLLARLYEDYGII